MVQGEGAFVRGARLEVLGPEVHGGGHGASGTGTGTRTGTGSGIGSGPGLRRRGSPSASSAPRDRRGRPPRCYGNGIAMATARSSWRACRRRRHVGCPPHREGREGRRCSLLPGPEAAQWNKAFCSPKGVVGVIICPQTGRVGVLVMGKLPTEGGGWGWFLLKCVCVFVNKWEKSKTLRPASAHVYMGEPVPLLSPMSRLS